jgi:hypothetical protein
VVVDATSVSRRERMVMAIANREEKLVIIVCRDELTCD